VTSHRDFGFRNTQHDLLFHSSFLGMWEPSTLGPASNCIYLLDMYFQVYCSVILSKRIAGGLLEIWIEFNHQQC